MAGVQAAVLGDTHGRLATAFKTEVCKELHHALCAAFVALDAGSQGQGQTFAPDPVD